MSSPLVNVFRRVVTFPEQLTAYSMANPKPSNYSFVLKV